MLLSIHFHVHTYAMCPKKEKKKPKTEMTGHIHVCFAGMHVIQFITFTNSNL
jgi:hypothetical protein